MRLKLTSGSSRVEPRTTHFKKSHLRGLIETLARGLMLKCFLTRAHLAHSLDFQTIAVRKASVRCNAEQGEMYAMPVF